MKVDTLFFPNLQKIEWFVKKKGAKISGNHDNFEISEI